MSTTARPLAATSCSSCLDIHLSDYSVFLLQDYIGGGDVEGKVAVGGNIRINGRTLGAQLPDGNLSNALVAGGNLELTDVHFRGEARYGGSYTPIGDVRCLKSTDCSVSPGIPFDFTARFAELSSLSARLDVHPPTGHTDVVRDPTDADHRNVNMNGTDPCLNVFDVKASDLPIPGRGGWSIDAPADSFVVINIHGDPDTHSVTFPGGISMGSLDSRRVIFNLVDITSLTANGMSLTGTVLAPDTDVTFKYGGWTGGIYARSLTSAGLTIYNNPLYEQCASGHCADGVCCDTACDGACDACNLADHVGTCTPVASSSAGSPSCAPYVCNGASASCPTACTTDSQCITGDYCSAGACVPKLANGATCSAANQCTSSNCVDGVCCNSACGDSCDACNVAGSMGTCTPVASSNSGSPTCAPYVCSGSSTSCPTACTTDSQCDSNNYCNAGACVPKMANGAVCSAANQCGSGNCVDGVCCNSACGGACDACNVTGSVGMCTPVASGSAGSPSCSPFVCGGSSASCPASCTTDSQCIAGDYCNAGACVPKMSNGAVCSAANQCFSGNCVDGFCCNTACGGACDACNVSGSVGTCTPVASSSAGSPSCAPYVCNGASASCPTACTTDSQCITGDYCSAGMCVPKKPNGPSCSAANECASGNCVDGVCCNTACGGACDACNLTGKAGTCTPLVTGSAGSPSCAPYVCNGASASCPTACTTDSQCIAGDYCNAGACVPKMSNGAVCSAANQCFSGNCVDGFCCNTACGGACDSCNAAGSVGTCTPVASGNSGSPSCSPYVCGGSSASCPTACTSDSQCIAGDYCNAGTCVPKKPNGPACSAANQCASGNCVDGVCCNSACGGACDSCNASGSLGTCSPVVSGSPGSPACAPYVCNGASASCPTACTTDSQCTSGSSCIAGTCVTVKPNGVACSAANQCASGNCVDGVCCNTTCNGGDCDACNLAGSMGTCSAVPSGVTCGDDGNVCTSDVCNGAGNCIHSPRTGASCGSGQVCNSAGTCESPPPARCPAMTFTGSEWHPAWNNNPSTQGTYTCDWNLPAASDGTPFPADTTSPMRTGRTQFNCDNGTWEASGPIRCDGRTKTAADLRGEPLKCFSLETVDSMVIGWYVEQLYRCPEGDGLAYWRNAYNTRDSTNPCTAFQSDTDYQSCMRYSFILSVRNGPEHPVSGHIDPNVELAVCGGSASAYPYANVWLDGRWCKYKPDQPDF